jgi:hypothetical protein
MMNCTLLIVILGIFAYDQKTIFRGYILAELRKQAFSILSKRCFRHYVFMSIITKCYISLSKSFVFHSIQLYSYY